MNEVAEALVKAVEVAVKGDDFVVIRVHGAGAGPKGLARFGLTGATTNDDILNLIFSTFCIGK